MEEKNLHVRIVPMTADHLDEVAEVLEQQVPAVQVPAPEGAGTDLLFYAVEPEYAGGGTGQLPVRIPCGAG